MFAVQLLAVTVGAPSPTPDSIPSLLAAQVNYGNPYECVPNLSVHGTSLAA